VLSDLKTLGFGVTMYLAPEDLYWDHSDVEGLVDNLDESPLTVDNGRMMAAMLQLSGFTDAPVALKPSLWLDSSEFMGIVRSAPGAYDPYETDDYAFWQKLQANPLTVKGTRPEFRYFHFYGSHYPAKLDANTQPTTDPNASLQDQTKGVFQIIYRYLDDLRALGLYDGATIIITADHGWHLPHYQRVLDHPLRPGLFYKPSGSSTGVPVADHAPTYLDNFRATIVEQAGGDPSAYGQIYTEVDPADPRTRRFYWYRRHEGDALPFTDVFDVTGDARIWGNWSHVDQIPAGENWNR
jgi:hypothetical protein